MATSFCAILLLLVISQQSAAFCLQPEQYRPFIYSALFALSALVLISIFNSWWSIFRAPSLLASPYNVRPAISDLYVARGDLLYRNHENITRITGQRGEYQSEILYPPLSPVIGYARVVYGETGLQAGMSSILQGLTGYPEAEKQVFQLLYSQTPPGLDVLTSLDATYQSYADRLLGDQQGAIILMNAQSGEIMVMASHPYFDVNRLEGLDIARVNDESAPFINRATQGQYPPGTALGPFLMAYLFENHQLEADDFQYSPIRNGDECAQQPDWRKDFATAVRYGCPGVGNKLTESLSTRQFTELYRKLAFDESPALPLPAAIPADLTGLENPLDEYLCSNSKAFLITPMQMALAVAAISENGRMPQAKLTTGFQDPDGNWQPLDSGGVPRHIFSPDAVKQTTSRLRNPRLPVWDSLGYATNAKGQAVTWYLAGTIDNASAESLSLVLVLEGHHPIIARESGERLLSFAIQP